MEVSGMDPDPGSSIKNLILENNNMKGGGFLPHSLYSTRK
jgi:hypothetical protein